MKTTSYDGAPERQALIDILASWDVADYIFQVIPEAPSIAGSSYAKTLMHWVFEYHPVSDGIPYASEALKKDWDAKGPNLPEDTRKGLKEFLDHVEERLLTEALGEVDGVKNKAAEVLGIKRTTLIEKLKKKNML